MFFAATAEEMLGAEEPIDSDNITKIIGDGDGDGDDKYLAALGVYHELHCLVSFVLCVVRQSHSDRNLATSLRT